MAAADRPGLPLPYPARGVWYGGAILISNRRSKYSNDYADVLSGQSIRCSSRLINSGFLGAGAPGMGLNAIVEPKVKKQMLSLHLKMKNICQIDIFSSRYEYSVGVKAL